MKKIYFTLFVVLLLASCGQVEKKAATANAGLKETVSIDSLIKYPEAFVGKEVTIKGHVFHTCTETGKRMFVYGSNSDSTLKVVASDSVKIFDKSLEGTEVLVKGTLVELKIDMAYLAKMEKEIKASEPKALAKKDKVAGNGHLHEGQNNMEQVNALKAKLKESGKDHLSFYSLVAHKLKQYSAEAKEEVASGGNDTTK
ncbi:MAG TPA: hypothetical protein VMV56_06915 [Williamwhitmania sp.]|nr:hypothetical protein [Williamwhitmania sp.]